ncbi:putative Protein Wnt-9a [Hypsibius exemplaris]|uniref:Protein Wnt n=1 Tax=Hypsibius exemplaris TaxID=2072580 RepID=A0A1W0W960_HYPEX|nr:putative Protein Wnt-9a [Hypsibius exemplaris]
MRFVPFGMAIFYLSSLSSFVDSFFGLASRRKVFEEPSIARWIKGITIRTKELDNSLPQFDDGYLCHMMNLTGKQRRICTREQGYPEVLMEALRISTRACQREFQYERWNCTLGFTRRNLLRTANRESAVLTAFAAAGMAYSVAKACSSGQLEFCSCDSNENTLGSQPSWMWKGCGDNFREGRAQTMRFLESSTPKKTRMRKIERHNVQVGIAVVKQASQQLCRCHGVSGSCTTRSCFTVLRPFKHAARSLHGLYRGPKKVSQEGLPIERGQKKKKPRVEMVLWTAEDSPDFCTRSKVSYGVAGRRCTMESPPRMVRRKRVEDVWGSCDTLCCERADGAGKTVARYENTTPVQCNCTYSAFRVNCGVCSEKEMRYYCA